MKTLQFKITGMHCEACIKLIKSELRVLPGIEDSEINFKSGIATITMDENTSTSEIIEAIKRIGYKAETLKEPLPEFVFKAGLVSSGGGSKRNILFLFAGIMIVGFAATAVASNLTLSGWLPFQNQASLFSQQALVKTPDADQSAGVCPISNSGAATGCPMIGNRAIPKASLQSSPKPASVPVQDKAVGVDSAQNVQTVRMTQSAYGYEPNEFTIKKGIPVKWIITSETTQSCAASIRMDDYNILQSLNEGENIIEFTPTKTGDIDFSCGMGMVTGRFTVTE